MLRDLTVPGNSKLSMKLKNLLSNLAPHTGGDPSCFVVLSTSLHPQRERVKKKKISQGCISSERGCVAASVSDGTDI